MKALKKLVKFIVWLVVTPVVVALLLVLTRPLWIGPVAKTAANRTVPGITGTDFRLGEFGFNYYTGKVRLGDVWLANPEGYSPSDALRLGIFNVDLDVASLFEDTIVIHEIALRDVFVSYVKKDGVYNFDVIADNAKRATSGGEGEPSVEPQQAPGEPHEIEIPQGAPKDEGGEPESGKKIIIDRVVISGVVVQWGPIPLPLPTITIRDIGRESGGVSLATAWREIYEKLMNQVNSLGKGLVSLGETGLGVATNSVNVVSEALSDSSTALLENSTVLTAAATNTVSVLTDALMVGVGAAMESVSGAPEAACETGNDAVESTTGALKTTGEYATDAVKATSETTSDAVKATGATTANVLKSTGDATMGVLKSTGEATTDAFKATGEVTVDALKASGDSLKSAGKELKAMGKDFKNMFKNNK